MDISSKSAAKAANENPWYCLATLYGEPSDDSPDLRSKNRVAWNRWIATALSDKRRAALLEDGFPTLELAPLTAEEQKEFCDAFAIRTGGSNSLPPRPSEPYDFRVTHFKCEVDFSGYLFEQHADFTFSQIDSQINFSRARFCSSVSFSKSIFYAVHDAYFDEASFYGVASFEETQFGLVFFRRAKFLGEVKFYSARFMVRADFAGTTFSDIADFSSAQFNVKGPIRHNFESYYGDAQLSSKDEPSRNAKFSLERGVIATFRGAHFRKNANFVKATFDCVADFREAMFDRDADFSSIVVRHDAFFGATFKSNVYFISAHFRCAYFVNANFGAITRFDKAIFAYDVPDFRGAKMHDATEWHGVSWPKPPLNDEQHAQYQVYTYERLKQEMERLKKHEDEQFFFCKELRARRGLFHVLSGAWIINFLYQILSNYGSSIRRPILWIIATFAAGFFFFIRTYKYSTGGI